jgi:UDP-glucose 4-epimerase
MTRFLLSLDQAVDTVFAALKQANKGETYIPRVPSANVVDIAAVLIGNRPVKTTVTGIRPGEKIHEILVSEEEVHRTIERGNYYVILPILPELRLPAGVERPLAKEYCSGDNVIARGKLAKLLKKHKLLVEDRTELDEELLA